MPGFRKLGERRIFTGKLISVATGTFETPDGETFERELVHHPGAVVVVPLHADGQVTLVRQYRAAVGEVLFEVPAGKRDVAGEDPEVTAARELAEEVGLRAGRLELLARFYNSPGFSDELTHLYLATALAECRSDAQGFEERHMTVERVPLTDFGALVGAGHIVDAKTIIGLCLASAAAG